MPDRLLNPLAAVAAALAGVGLAVADLTSLPLTLAGMVVAYGATVLVTPEAAPTSIEAAEERGKRLRRRLAQEVARVPDRPPHGPVATRLRALQRELDGLLSTSSSSALSDGSFDVARIVEGYLPAALTAYGRIPESRVGIAATGGRSPQAILLDQLEVMDAGVQQAATALTAGDVDALLAQERFLRQRFGPADELAL